MHKYLGIWATSGMHVVFFFREIILTKIFVKLISRKNKHPNFSFVSALCIDRRLR